MPTYQIQEVTVNVPAAGSGFNLKMDMLSRISYEQYHMKNSDNSGTAGVVNYSIKVVLSVLPLSTIQYLNTLHFQHNCQAGHRVRKQVYTDTDVCNYN
jgi:hypothetical protein